MAYEMFKTILFGPTTVEKITCSTSSPPGSTQTVPDVYMDNASVNDKPLTEQTVSVSINKQMPTGPISQQMIFDPISQQMHFDPVGQFFEPVDEHKPLCLGNGKIISGSTGPLCVQRPLGPLSELKLSGPLSELRSFGPFNELRLFGPISELRSFGPLIEQRAGRPLSEQRAGRPSSEQRAGRPSSEQRAGRPSSEQRAGRPLSEQRAGRPSSEQRAGRPSSEQRAGRPSSEQRAGRPSSDQRAGRPSIEQRAGGPPSEQRADGPPSEQRAAGCPSDLGDNANVNFGGINRREGNKVFSHLKEALSKPLVGVGCSAHVLHNRIQHGTDLMQTDVESILLKIFNYFSIYTVRTETLKDFCDYVTLTIGNYSITLKLDGSVCFQPLRGCLLL